MMENVPTLGKILGTAEQRDAVHIAIAPVVASEPLKPGQHIGLSLSGFAGTNVALIGVVDPFLLEPVLVGQRFYMFLYPGTITSLRHEWSHPAFPASVDDKAASEAWLRSFCETADCPGYEATIAAAIDNGDTWDRQYLHFDGRDAHGDIPPEFWHHVEVVTGQKIAAKDRAKYFSCSC